jgi:hypothetical protein
VNAIGLTAIVLVIFKTLVKRIIGATASITRSIDPMNAQKLKIFGLT